MFEEILEYTVRRQMNHTRGRLADCFDPDSTLSVPHEQERLNKACKACEDFFNDDVRLPYPVHIRTDRTRNLSRSELVDMGVNTLCELHLLPGMVSDVPSPNKWGTLAEHLQGQVGGMPYLRIFWRFDNRYYS